MGKQRGVRNLEQLKSSVENLSEALQKERIIFEECQIKLTQNMGKIKESIEGFTDASANLTLALEKLNKAKEKALEKFQS